MLSTHPRATARPRRRVALAVAGASVAAVGLAAPQVASAGIWTPVASGTTDTISAVSHRAERTVFGTTTGKVHVVGAGQRGSWPGLTVTDLATSPSGNTVVATLSGGKYARSADGGLTWGAAIDLYSYRVAETGCRSSAQPPLPLAPIGQDATSVAWASDSVGYMTTNLGSSLQQTTNGGVSWSEINRAADGVCRLGSLGELTDVAPVVGSNSVYLIEKSFGGIWFSSDAFAGAPSKRDDALNCFTERPSLAVDSADPSRLVAGDRCGGRLNMPRSIDSGASFSSPDVIPEVNASQGIHDVSYVGGTAIWAGNGGHVFTSINSIQAYDQPADGALATTEWRTVDAYSAANAAIGGVGGALAVSAAANTTPPLPTLPGTGTGTGTGPGTGAGTTIPGTTPGGTSTGKLPGGGASLTLTGPTSTCVASGASFNATLKMRKLQIKNNKIVKLTRVDFYLNKKRIKIDRKAPFKQKITVPASAPGTIHTLKAKGFVKVKKGKAPKRTQTVKFAVC